MKLSSPKQKERFVKKAGKLVDGLPPGFTLGRQNIKYALAEYFANEKGLTNYKRRIENEEDNLSN